MSIQNVETVDIVTIDRQSGKVLLTISDHLVWGGAEGIHLTLLQGKLNSYLRFVESGELVRKYPETLGRDVVINLVSRFPLSSQGTAFIEKAATAIRGAGLSFEFKVFDPDSKEEIPSKDATR
jgi:hypothetical protein